MAGRSISKNGWCDQGYCQAGGSLQGELILRLKPINADLEAKATEPISLLLWWSYRNHQIHNTGSLIGKERKIDLESDGIKGRRHALGCVHRDNAYHRS